VVWTLSRVEGVPDGHIVHFILDAVEQLPITDFRVNERGSGSEQYPPAMMLALLIYCYATGRFGSRTIEAASYSDVAVRYLCANHHPDHDSICAFRTANKQAFEAGKKPRGPEPTPPSETPDPKARYNFTDPQSAIMKAGSGQHFEQCYNAQAAVDEAMLIVGACVPACRGGAGRSVAANDKKELPPTVAAISPVVAPQVETVLTDSGFYSEAAVKAVEQNPDGTPTGVTVYAAVEKSDPNWILVRPPSPRNHFFRFHALPRISPSQMAPAICLGARRTKSDGLLDRRRSARLADASQFREMRIPISPSFRS